MKSRIEVNENGDFFILVPDDVIAEAGLDEGDQLEWDANDPELLILSIV